MRNQQQNNQLSYATTSPIGSSQAQGAAPTSDSDSCSSSVVMRVHMGNIQASQRIRRESSSILAIPSASDMSRHRGSTASLNNLLRMRNCLGHSAPQLTSPSLTGLPPITLRHHTKDRFQAIQRRHSQRVAPGYSNRRSLTASSRRGSTISSCMSPISLRSRSPLLLGSQLQSPLVQNSAGTGGDSPPLAQRVITKGASKALHYSSSVRHEPNTGLRPPPRAAHDTRRWSLVSLPSSTSGYGSTNAASSSISSQCSSTEHLQLQGGVSSRSSHAANDQWIASMQGLYLHRPMATTLSFGSDDSYPSIDELHISVGASADATLGPASPCDSIMVSDRLRSRSFVHSPVKLSSSCSALDQSACGSSMLSEDDGITQCSAIYREKFPRAKAEMELKLDQFIKDEQKRLLPDGAESFLHKQIIELAANCLQLSSSDQLTAASFSELSLQLHEIMVQAVSKCDYCLPDLDAIVRRLLVLIARPARLLECLMFDAGDFMDWLDMQEASCASECDIESLPTYIVKQLGLHQDDPASASGSEGLVSAESSCESALPPPPSPKPRPPPPKADDFDLVKLISNGAYGAVYLVRHRETKQRFALKRLSKANLVLRNQLSAVFAERDILTFSDNPFVVSFYGSFETERHLCMVLEFVEGGDCATLLKNISVFPVEMARLYMSETILAIEYLHSCGIVHRDLKPDNLLITADGHIKLTDFGLSKIGLMNRTNLLCEADVEADRQFWDKQVCGTPEYIAPEVILRQGYSKPVDWWALGIILYEFLVGCPPFFGDTPEELFAHVLATSDCIEWPEEPYTPPFEAQSLVCSLLQQNPNNRLGSRLGAAELKSHPFFSTISWTTVLREKVEFLPQLSGEDDTSYFDTREDRYDHSEDQSTGSECLSMLPVVQQKLSTSHNEAMLTQDMMSLHSPPLSGSSACRRSLHSGSSSPFAAFSSSSPRYSLIADTSAGFSPDKRINKDLHVGSSAESATPQTAPTELSRKKHHGRSINQQPSTDTEDGETTLLDTSGQHCQQRRRGRNPGTAPAALPKFSFSSHDESVTEQSGSKELSPLVESTSPASSSGVVPKLTVSSRTSQGSPPAIVTAASPPSPHGNALHLIIPSPSPTGSNNSPAKDSSSPSPKAGSLLSRRTGGQNVSPIASKKTPPLIGAEPAGMSTSGSLSFLKPPIVMRRDPNGGFGFTLRAIRVHGVTSDYYTIQHIVTQVEVEGSAFEAGLRANDLITHVNGETVSNLTHTEVMQKLMSGGDVMQLRCTPLDQSSIRLGPSRRAGAHRTQHIGVPTGYVRRRSTPKHHYRGSGSSGALVVSGKNSERRRSSRTAGTSLMRRVSSTSKRHSVELKPLSRSISSSESLLAVGLASPPTVVETVTQPVSSSRPSSLHGIGEKFKRLKTPRLRQQTSMPLSPLARSEAVQPPPPSSNTVRSPSPLMSASVGSSSGSQPTDSTPHRAMSSAGKKTITKPRKSDAGSSSSRLSLAGNDGSSSKNE